MRITQISEKQKKDLEIRFKKEKQQRQAIRYQALLLLANCYPREEVARIVGRNQHRLRQWVGMYHRDGVDGLSLKPIQGNHRLLTPIQKQIIKHIVTTSFPRDNGYFGKTWTIPLLKDLVKEKFAVMYHHDDSYRRLLHWCKPHRKKNKTLHYRFYS